MVTQVGPDQGTTVVTGVTSKEIESGGGKDDTTRETDLLGRGDD